MTLVGNEESGGALAADDLAAADRIPASVPAASPRRPRILPTWAPVALMAAALAAGAGVLMHANRHDWFFGDDWDFLALRGLHDARHSVLAPHLEHWVTTPILVYRALYTVFRLHTHTPYVVVLVAFHLAVCALLWCVLLRAGVDRWIATMLTVIVVFMGTGFENLLWAFQITVIGSLATGLVTLLLVDHDGPADRRDLCASAVAAFGLTFSGVTLPMVGAATLLILLRRSWRDALRFAVPPAVVYLTWFATAGRSGVDHSRTSGNIPKIPEYVGYGITHGYDVLLRVHDAGVVVVVVLAGAMIACRGWFRTRGAVATASATAAVVMVALAGAERASQGIVLAASSRYVYVTIILLMPACGLVLTMLTRRWRLLVPVLAVPVALVVIANVNLLYVNAKDRSNREQGIKRQLLATADLIRSGAPIFSVQPEPKFSPDLDIAAMAPMVAEGAFPHDAYGTVDRLAAAASTQVALDLPMPSAQAQAAAGVKVPVLATLDTTRARGANGCSTFTPTGPAPQFVVDVRSPVSLTITTAVATEVQLVMRDRGDVPTAAPPRPIAVPAGTHALNLMVPPSLPVLMLPAAPGPALQICGLAG